MRKNRERTTFQLSDAYNFTVHLLKKTQMEPKANLDNDIDGMIKFSVEFDKGREMLFNFPFFFLTSLNFCRKDNKGTSQIVSLLLVLCGTKEMKEAALKTVFWAEERAKMCA